MQQNEDGEEEQNCPVPYRTIPTVESDSEKRRERREPTVVVGFLGSRDASAVELPIQLNSKLAKAKTTQQHDPTTKFLVNMRIFTLPKPVPLS